MCRVGVLFKNCNIGYKNGNKSKVKVNAGSTNVIESLNVLYNGELEAIGEKVNPVRFVAASDRDLHHLLMELV